MNLHNPHQTASNERRRSSEQVPVFHLTHIHTHTHLYFYTENELVNLYNLPVSTRRRLHPPERRDARTHAVLHIVTCVVLLLASRPFLSRWMLVT